MTREAMLKKLGTVEFTLIDPLSDWKDIGFTEREIWVNSKGYGYISCDEPVWCWEGSGLSNEKWKEIRSKIQNRELQLEDIRDTSIYDLLNDWRNPIEDEISEFDEGYSLSDAMSRILLLPENELKELYCMDTIEGLMFFDSVKDFKENFERDWCDYEWSELSDQILAEWIQRLFA